MERYDLDEASDPRRMGERARQTFAQHAGHDEHAGHSVREVEYRGHKIRIETTYVITVDGQPVTGHVMVDNDGQVHYHSIPNQEFASAVDMVERLIDLAPTSAGGGGGGEEPEPPTHDHHHH